MHIIWPETVPKPTLGAVAKIIDITVIAPHQTSQSSVLSDYKTRKCAVYEAFSNIVSIK